MHKSILPSVKATVTFSFLPYTLKKNLPLLLKPRCKKPLNFWFHCNQSLNDSNININKSETKSQLHFICSYYILLISYELTVSYVLFLNKRTLELLKNPNILSYPQPKISSVKNQRVFPHSFKISKTSPFPSRTWGWGVGLKAKPKPGAPSVTCWHSPTLGSGLSGPHLDAASAPLGGEGHWLSWQWWEHRGATCSGF